MKIDWSVMLRFKCYAIHFWGRVLSGLLNIGYMYILLLLCLYFLKNCRFWMNLFRWYLRWVMEQSEWIRFFFLVFNKFYINAYSIGLVSSIFVFYPLVHIVFALKIVKMSEIEFKFFFIWKWKTHFIKSNILHILETILFNHLVLQDAFCFMANRKTKPKCTAHVFYIFSCNKTIYLYEFQ